MHRKSRALYTRVFNVFFCIMLCGLFQNCNTQAARESQDVGITVQPGEAPQSGIDNPETIAGDALLDRIYSSKYTGDLDELVEKRIIRVLVVSSPMFYFLDGAKERGITYESMKEFEKFLNKKFKTGNLPVSVVLLPVSRDQLIPRLVEGKGDIASANLTVTPERSRLVDFSKPTLKGVSELLVSSADAPAVKTLDDLSGKTIYVRASSSYHESLLVKAQAYQESKLNQNARSRAGAVGVMQITPSTAAGPPINIKNIEKLVQTIVRF